MSELTLVESGPGCMRFKPIVEQLMEGREYPVPLLFDSDFVMLQAWKGEWQLWFVFEQGQMPSMMMVTTVDEFPGGKVCTILLVVGEDFFSYASNMGKFEAWLAHEGVQVLQTWTPPTLAKRSERYGFKQSNVLVFKDYRRMN